MAYLLSLLALFGFGAHDTPNSAHALPAETIFVPNSAHALAASTVRSSSNFSR